MSAARAARTAIVSLALLALPAAARTALGPRYGGDLVVGVPEMPASIEPGPLEGAASSLLNGLVHETLVGIDAEGLPVPALVDGWTAAADGREWRLSLRAASTFHDGRPVTAEEALSALRRFLRSDSAAAAWLAAALDGGTAFRNRATSELPGAGMLDGLHLVLRFLEPRALPLAPLAAPAAAVTGPRGAGCGPFVPLAPTPGRKIRLAAFAGHVRGRPFLDAVEVVAPPGLDAVEAEFRAGHLDVIPGGDGPASLSAVLVLVLDSSRPPFNRPEARAAAAAAIDRADIVKRLLRGGDAAPSLLAPALLPPLTRSDSPRTGPVSGAVGMAVAEDVPPLVSQRIVASLGAIGLRVEARAVPPLQARTAATAVRLFLWSPEVPEAGLALHELLVFAPGVRTVDEALAAASRELDLDRRRALLHGAEAALRAENRLVPVASVPVSFRTRPGIHDIRVDLSGRLVLEDAWREP